MSNEETRQEKTREVHASVRERRQRERRLWRTAFLVSAAAHLLLFLIGPGATLPESPFSAAGPRALDDQAAAGSMQAVSLSAAPPDAAIPPPTPVPDVEIPPPEEVEIEPEAIPEIEIEVPEVPLPGVGATTGDDPADQGDPGLPEASGAGDAGSAEEGLFRVVAPRPRGIIPPMSTSSVRGQEVEVWVFVDEAGQVIPDSTRLDPATSDRRFNEQLKEQAGRWVFEPARRGEERIASWWSYRVSM